MELLVSNHKSLIHTSSVPGVPAWDEGGIRFEGVTRLVRQGGGVGRGGDVLVRNVKVEVVRQPYSIV